MDVLPVSLANKVILAGIMGYIFFDLARSWRRLGTLPPMRIGAVIAAASVTPVMLWVVVVGVDGNFAWLSGVAMVGAVLGAGLMLTALSRHKGT